MSSMRKLERYIDGSALQVTDVLAPAYVLFQRVHDPRDQVRRRERRISEVGCLQREAVHEETPTASSRRVKTRSRIEVLLGKRPGRCAMTGVVGGDGLHTVEHVVRCLERQETFTRRQHVIKTRPLRDSTGRPRRDSRRYGR